MQKQKKLSARILSLVLTAAMVGTIATVFAAPAAAAGESCYEAITIAPGSLNGNTVWGVTEALDSSIRLDNYASFYANKTGRSSDG
ncbi:MAG: hypothetical protein RR263_05675, partial [Oscillospiraceae bacterium]